MANRKEFQALIKIVVKHGWKVEPTKNGHYRWTAPSGSFFFSSSTSSDKRALERVKADLRRLGLDVRTL